MTYLAYPPDGHETDSESIFFVGSAEHYCRINGRDVALSATGNFAPVFDLQLGKNIFEIDIDGEKFTRNIIAKTSNVACPIAFARPYRAFVSPNASKENILRTILVENNQVIIPLASRPEYQLEVVNPLQASLALGSIAVDLDWIFYAPGEDAIVNIEYQAGEIRIDFAANIESIAARWLGSALVLDYELGSDLSLVEAAPTMTSLLVCIDPGHGGLQTGAISPKGLAEKTLNLELAVKLADELDALGIKNFLTRDSDKDLSLQERVALCKNNHAQVFISLHHNALPDGRDPQRERGISLHYYHLRSRDFALKILGELTCELELPSAGLYRQNLHVLRENDAELAILVEAGYLIHPEESELITTDKFQRKMAKTIANFLNQYQNTH